MSEPAQACLSLLLCIVAAWLLFSGRRAVWATTLRAAWCWGVLTLIVLAAVEMACGISPDLTHAQTEMLRFAAAVLVFTPTMALLGAKRPQNVAWQFVIVTLWGVLALPAFELWLRGRGEQLSIDAIRSWFLVVMIVMGAVNHFPTCFGLAAAQLALSQIALLWSHLPFIGSSEVRPPVWIALGLMLSAALTARWVANHAARDASGSGSGLPLPSWSYVWREFRDWYGTVWGVRIMERINASAEVHKWPVLLGWDGFVWKPVQSVESASPVDSVVTFGAEAGKVMSTRLVAEQQAAIEQSLSNLLRRFVSARWLEERLQSGRLQS